MSTEQFVPATTIAEVIERLDVIVEESIQKGRRAGYFAALYRRVTIAVRDKINEGYFEDNVRMERLDIIFANRYLEAYHQMKFSQKCSESWQMSFDAFPKWRLLVIQHLFVGMNAHIGLDLGIATAETQPDNIDDLKNDFGKINNILNELTDVVQDDLASFFPSMKLLDRITGGSDEKLAGFAMEIARDAAWEVAKTYNALSPQNRPDYLKKRDRDVAGFSNKIVSPGFRLNVLIAIFKLFEKGSVSRKIKLLAD